jgi:hypothetical protein
MAKTEIKAYSPDKSIRVEKVKIAPEDAEEMLRKNKHNRPIVNSAFERMSRDIKEGNWRLTGDTIKFDPMGGLIDGQHRLWACIEAGVPFESFVAYGVSADAFDVIDTGMKRSVGALLSIRKETNTANLAAVSALVWKYKHKYLQKAAPVRPTSRESFKTLDDNPAIREACIEAKKVRHLVSQAVAGFVFWATSQKDSAQTLEFFEKLATGENLLQGDPILALRERLIKNKTSIGKMRQRELVILMLKAWNAHREKRKIRHIQVMRKERGFAADEFPDVL